MANSARAVNHAPGTKKADFGRLGNAAGTGFF
jgi:hypothetical protein